MNEVIPLFLAELVLEFKPATLTEVGSDCLLARVAEWRIAQVVGQAGSSDNLADVTKFVGPWLILVARHEPYDNFARHRLAHTGNFQAVRQAVVHKDAVGQRKYLRLVLQAAERRREHQAVVVALKVAPYSPTLVVVVMFQPQAFVRNQSVPIHALNSHHDKIFYKITFFSAKVQNLSQTGFKPP